MSFNRPEEEWELPDAPTDDPTDHARAREARPDPVSRYRVILDRFGEVGGWTRDAAEELSGQWGMTVGAVQDDASTVKNFLTLLDDLEDSRPFLMSNLAALILAAKDRGKYADAAKLLEVHAKVTGAIQPAGGTSVNQYFDQRTGAFAPAVNAGIVAIVEQAVSAALDAYELAPGDRAGAMDAAAAAAGRRLSGGPAGLLAKGE